MRTVAGYARDVFTSLGSGSPGGLGLQDDEDRDWVPPGGTSSLVTGALRWVTLNQASGGGK